MSRILENNVPKLSAFVLTEDELNGHLTVTIDTEGKPISAAIFGKLILDNVRLLRACCDKSKPTDFAIIEANMIDDRASFTLKAYPKSWFKEGPPEELRAQV